MISTRGIASPAAQAQAKPADRDAVGNLGDDDQRKVAGGRREGKQAGAHRGDGKAVKNQRRSVVGEAFAFEHDDEPARDAQTADDGERRNRVRRRHDGAEHEADRQRHAEEPMRRRRYRTSGEDDTAESKQRDRPQIELEFTPAHGNAGRIDQRRQNAEQYQFRRQFDARQAGRQRQRDAGDDEKYGRRGIEPPRHHGDDDQHSEEEQNSLDRRRHES